MFFKISSDCELIKCTFPSSVESGLSVSDCACSWMMVSINFFTVHLEAQEDPCSNHITRKPNRKQLYGCVCSPEVNVVFLGVTGESVEVDRQETEAWFL